MTGKYPETLDDLLHFDLSLQTEIALYEEGLQWADNILENE